MTKCQASLLSQYIAVQQAAHGPRWPAVTARQIAANAPHALALLAQLGALRQPGPDAR